MKQISLGKTGETVGALALGCMHFGTRTDKTTSVQLLDQYVDTGGTFLDTANNYAFWAEGASGGESETLLGEWLRDHNREDLFIASKVGAMPTVPGGGFETAEGLSAESIEAAIDGSLERLETDYLDLYYAHIDDRTVPLKETLGAFDALIKSGKVRHIGCSNLTAARLEKALNISDTHGFTPYSCIQQRYSYLQPGADADFGVQVAVDEALLGLCHAHHVTLLAYSPLLGGAYTRADVPLPEEYRGEASEARLAVLREIAAEAGATPNQVVLAWLRQSSPVALPVIAASTSEQLAENLGALAVTLTPNQLRALNVQRELRRV